MLFLVSIAVAIVGAAGSFVEPTIWPMPSDATFGTASVPISNNIKFKPQGVHTIDEAFIRSKSLMFPHGHHEHSDNFQTVSISVTDPSEAYPQMDTDESYTLSVPSDSTSPIEISSATVYGTIRALESLSQLVFYDFDSHAYYVWPCTIADTPRFAHRGMLLDTARHYESIPNIRRTIDALSYAKYNVLHWHIVDTQSFPFESKTYPKLWEGSYSAGERYTQEDVIDLVEYGRMRGIKLMIEFDMPGHAASWCAGYPDICPSSCTEPLSPASNATFPLITSLLSECTGNVDGVATDTAALFPYELLHLGGDEVNYKCWEKSEEVLAWEEMQGYDKGSQGSEQTYEYFVDKVANITRAQKRIPVQWVEVFEHFGANLDQNTIVHVWKEKETLDQVLEAGYRALLSNQGLWYLDHLDISWDQMYNNEPTDGLSNQDNAKFILGGESCMWSETVDVSDLDSTVWPRAAAVAERLWTPMALMDVDAAEDRLHTFRCLLNARGIAAAPVTNIRARTSPSNPGSCYTQRRR